MFLFSWLLGRVRELVTSTLQLVLTRTIGLNSFLGLNLKDFNKNVHIGMEDSSGSASVSTPNFIFCTNQQNGSSEVQSESKDSDKSLLTRTYSSASLFKNPLVHLNQKLASWQWIPTSRAALEEAEKKLLQSIKSSIQCKYISVWRGKFQVWAAMLNSRYKSTTQTQKNMARESEKIPLVLIHGLGGGIGLWVKNFDALCQNRTVYALDLLGFGKSSRPPFSNEAGLVEQEWVQSIEDFRQDAKIDKMILLGHSLGGYLSCIYAMEYPERVRHLILADPWGFGVKTLESERSIRIPSWVRTVASVASIFNPLAALRAMGPYGQSFLRRVRPDFGRKFSDHAGADAVFDYIYHCNVQPPSGESAFKSLTMAYGWAKRPMIERVGCIPVEIPMTFIYGSRSWIDCTPAYEIQRQVRPDAYVRVEVISGAGHHVYADNADVFNELVNEVCDIVDSGNDILSPVERPDDFNVMLKLTRHPVESVEN